MRKASALFAALALAAGLRANPDLDGWGALSGGFLLSGARQQGSYLNNSVGVQGDYRVQGSHSYGFQAVGPLTESLSVQASIVYFGYNETFIETAGNNGSLGRYQQDLLRNGQSAFLGLRFYPGAFIHGDYLPGLGNPDGPLYVPVISGGYYQGSAENRFTLGSATLGYASSKANDDYRDRNQGFEVGLEFPLMPRITLAHSYTHETWFQAYNDKGSSSRDHGWENLSFSAILYLPLNSPEPSDLAEHLPHQGRPGSLRLALGYDYENWIARASSGQTTAWASARYAFNSAFGLGLSLAQTQLPSGPLDRKTSYRDSNRSLSSQSLGLSAFFNFGSPLWRGRKPSDPVDIKPQGIPKELPDPGMKPEEKAPVPEEAQEAGAAPVEELKPVQEPKPAEEAKP